MRRSNGSMLIFTGVIFLGIVIAIGLFIFSFMRFLGGHQEQSTAIEGAAIAAANDLSKIVIDDPDFGFLSISDAPPVGKATAAADNYYLPVTGINTLLATVRLDTIIAEKLDDNTMRSCAKRDYTRSLAAKDRLVTALQGAIATGGYGFDMDGNKVEPLVDAVQAYQSNLVRMTDRKASLDVSSMKLSLGCIPELITCCPVPQPTEFAEMNQDQQANQYYKSYINIPFRDSNFVFAGIGDSTKLVDSKLFVENIPSLPYIIPTIVKCEADEMFAKTELSGATSIVTVHGIACAQPASLNDHRPASGALSISFPNGAISSLNSLKALLLNGSVNKSPADRTETVLAGDHPPSALSKVALPVIKTVRPPFGHLLRISFYDWLHRMGPKINVASLLTAMETPLSTNTEPHADTFRVDSKGMVQQSSISIDPNLVMPVSHKQWYAVSGLAYLGSSGSQFDIYIRDYVYQSGRTNGGKHGGEPLGDAAGSAGGASTDTASDTMNEAPSILSAFPDGPAGGAIRPSYNQLGVAVDIRLRKRPAKIVP